MKKEIVLNLLENGNWDVKFNLDGPLTQRDFNRIDRALKLQYRMITRDLSLKLVLKADVERKAEAERIAKEAFEAHEARTKRVSTTNAPTNTSTSTVTSPTTSK